MTGQEQERFCPGELNAADPPSRGCSRRALSENEKWLHGPEFLKCPADMWPKLPHLTSLVDEAALTEIFKTLLAVTQSLVSLTDIPFSLAKIELIMDCSRYSTMVKLWRVTALVLRFVRKLKQEINDRGTELLSADDLREAKILWIKSIQATAFSEDIQRLSAKRVVPNQLIKQLGLYFDEKGVIRCEGRLENSTIPLEIKNPIVIPSKRHVTEMVI